MTRPEFSPDLLELDAAAETDRICDRIKDVLSVKLKRRGLVVGVSGGIDSSVTLALCVRAIGADKVVALQMPEKHSASETLHLSGLVADAFGVTKHHEDISEILNAAGCYSRYDEAVRLVLPAYGSGWKSKIVIPSIVENNGYSIFSVVAQSPEGRIETIRLSLPAYLGILAATNFKQRVRKMLEYYYADRLNYATTGTPNRLEYDQGFFVKLGDGAADIKPIAHLYKSQVYKLAQYIGVPKEICLRPPTTDTYSLPQGQDEFYFSLSFDKMDLCLYGKNNGYSAQEVAPFCDLSTSQTERVFKDIDGKRNTTRYLHLGPQLVGNVPEISVS